MADEFPADQEQAARGLASLRQPKSKVKNWDCPYLDDNSGQMVFFFKSLITLKSSNYHRALSSLHITLRDLYHVHRDRFKTSGSAADLAYTLAWMKADDGAAFIQIISACSFKHLLDGLDLNTAEAVGQRIEDWAQQRHNMNRKRNPKEQLKREQQLALRVIMRNMLYLRLQMRNFSNLGARLTAGAFRMPLGSSTGQLTLCYDYSAARKSHTFAMNGFFLDDVSMGLPGEDVESSYDELHFVPLPLSNARKNCLKRRENLDATVFSGVAFLYYTTMIFGVDSMAKLKCNRDTSWEQVDIDCLSPGGNAFNINVLPDQGSSECRFGQLVGQLYPGTFRFGVDHRLSNNCKGLTKGAAELSSGWRSYLRGPRSSKENQGDFFKTWESLLDEARAGAQIAARAYGPELINEQNKATLEEALEKRVELYHGTNARFFRDTTTCDMFLKDRYKVLYVLKAVTGRAVAAAPRRGRPAGRVASDDEADETMNMLDIDTEDSEAAKKSKKLFCGNVEDMCTLLEETKMEDLRAQLDVSQGHYDYFLLLEKLNTAHASPACLDDPAILASARKFLGDHLLADDAFSAPDVQDLLAANRDRIWRILAADAFQAGRKSASHAAAALTLVGRVINCYFFDTADPQHGLWESFIHGRVEVPAVSLPRLATCWSFPLSYHTKRMMRCLKENKMQELKTAVTHSNRSYPITESDIERRFKERRVQDKTNCSALHSGASKQVQQTRRQHPRYPCIAAASKYKTPILLPHTVEEKANEIASLGLSQERLRSDVALVEEQQRAGATSESAFLTGWFDKFKRGLEHLTDYPRQRVEACLVDLVDLLKEDTATVKAEHPGFRGVEALVILERGAIVTSAQLRFYEMISKQLASLKLVDAKLKEKGFVIIRKQNKYYSIHRHYSGYIMTVDLHHVANRLTWPSTQQDTKFGCGLLCFFDVYDGGYQVGIGGAAGLFIELKNPSWCSSSASFAALYKTVPHAARVASVAPFMQQHGLVDTDFDNVPADIMHQLFKRMTIGEADAALAASIKRKANRVVAVDAVESGLHEEVKHTSKKRKMKNAASSSTALAKPKAAPKRRVDGNTREPAKYVYEIWSIAEQPSRVVAEVRSHRNAQGGNLDTLRLHWPKGHAPEVAKIAPETDIIGDIKKNIIDCLYPAVILEYGLQNAQQLQLKHVRHLVDEEEDSEQEELDKFNELYGEESLGE